MIVSEPTGAAATQNTSTTSPTRATLAGNLTADIPLHVLEVEGTVPSWLAGAFIRNGPGRIDFGPRVALRHWFDGMAFLQRFAFEHGTIVHNGAFVRSTTYADAVAGRTSSRGFGTDPPKTLANRIRNVAGNNVTDNVNVNIADFGDAAVAMTEGILPRAFDRTTLATLAPYRFTDAIPLGPSTAHPARVANTWVNVTTHFGPRNSYTVWALENGSRTRRPLARIPTARPAYTHDIAVSERYAILLEVPLTINSLDFVLSGKPFIENFTWGPQRGTLFHLIDLNGGGAVITCTGEPFFTFHHAAAFDDGDDVVLDTVAYDDPSLIAELSLQSFLHSEYVSALPTLRRYRISRSKRTVTRERLTDENFEFPRVNRSRNAPARKRYVYGAQGTLDASVSGIVRVDTSDGSAISWRRANELPCEPVFVARPGATDEDDGAVLTVALNTERNASALLVLDGKTLEERARAWTQPLPLGFHGQFFRA